MRYLSGREHSRTELERKLAPYAQDPSEIASVLDALQAKGFISEERVAASLVSRRSTRWGDRRIRQELHAKGLNADTITQAMEPLEGTELERAQATWERKFGTPATDAAGRARQMRFLLMRGFSMDAVRQAVGKNQWQ